MILNKTLFLPMLILMLCTPVSATTGCGEQGVWLQVLGSGGPELGDGRASSGYVIWQTGKARLLIDIGTGSLFRFEQSGASVNDLDAVLLSHLHVDHSNDLPALIKASFFSDRKQDLYLYGPSGNSLMPSTTNFVQDLLGEDGAYKYLSHYLDGSENYRLLPFNVDVAIKTEQSILVNSSYRLTALSMHHGPIPALAWRIEMAGKIIVFSGDMNNDHGTLQLLAKQADILVAHHAVPEEAKGVARNLHMTPSIIGQIAAKSNIKHLVLSHRMKRTIGQEKISKQLIRKQYSGPLQFADDLQCFRL